MRKSSLMLAGVMVAMFAGSAMADEYYVVRSPSTHHCTITTTKPVDRTVVTQIGPIAFASRDQAEERIRTTKVCSDATTGSGTTIIKEDHD